MCRSRPLIPGCVLPGDTSVARQLRLDRARLGNYFRTVNAARKFGQAADYVVFRLRRLMITKRGRNLRAGQARARTQEWFNGHGL